MGQSSGYSVDGVLEDSVGTVKNVRFEMDTKVIDEKDRLDRVGELRVSPSRLHRLFHLGLESP